MFENSLCQTLQPSREFGYHHLLLADSLRTDHQVLWPESHRWPWSQPTPGSNQGTGGEKARVGTKVLEIAWYICKDTQISPTLTAACTWCMLSL